MTPAGRPPDASRSLVGAVLAAQKLHGRELVTPQEIGEAWKGNEDVARGTVWAALARGIERGWVEKPLKGHYRVTPAGVDAREQAP